MLNGPLHILAVDDEPLILMNLVDMLEDLGHVVISAPTGKQALEQLKLQRFDVLVTDQSMPQMTGDQLIAHAKTLHPEIGVILTTGYAEPPQGLLPFVVKMNKPYTDQRLADALVEAVQTG